MKNAGPVLANVMLDGIYPENLAVPETKGLEVHKALADDTRYRLYRYVGLAGRPVSVREMSRRLSLHPNTLRPHLRRLEEAGLVSREVRKSATVGRPQTLYSARQAEEGGWCGEGRPSSRPRAWPGNGVHTWLPKAARSRG